MKRAIPGLILFGLLLIPGFAWVVGFGEAADENRALTEWPELDLESLRTAEAFDIAGQAVIDRLPLRKEAAQANSEILLRALNESSDPRVVPGAEGWLFFANAVEQRCLAADPDTLPATIDRANAVVTSTGRGFHLLIAPDKAAIYPDRLSVDTCADGNAPLLHTYAEATPFVSYPAEALIQSRAEDASGYGPYFQWDTHWNQIGAAQGARAVVTALSDGLWDDAALEVTSEGAREADLAAMLGIEWTEPSPQLSIVRPGTTSGTTTLENLPGTDGEPIASATRNQYEASGPAGHLIPGTTVLLHDSFGLQVIPTLHPYFASLQTIRYRPIDEASAAAIDPADRVVLVLAQRNLYDAVIAAKLDVRFAEVLHPEMTPATWTQSNDEDGLTVTVDQMPGCTAWYLVSDRPEDQADEYTVDSARVGQRANSTTHAAYSSTGRWSIGDASGVVVESIRVVAVCDDESG